MKRYCDYDYDTGCIMFFDGDDSDSKENDLNIQWIASDDSSDASSKHSCKNTAIPFCEYLERKQLKCGKRKKTSSKQKVASNKKLSRSKSTHSHDIKSQQKIQKMQQKKLIIPTTATAPTTIPGALNWNSHAAQPQYIPNNHYYDAQIAKQRLNYLKQPLQPSYAQNISVHPMVTNTMKQLALYNVNKINNLKMLANPAAMYPTLMRNVCATKPHRATLLANRCVTH